MIKIGILVGAAPLGAASKKLTDIIKSYNRNDLFIVAADGGIEYFLENNISPDRWIGDMDSAGDIKEKVLSIFPQLSTDICSPIKDVTDMCMAIEEAKNMGSKKIYMFGGSGGKRNEHTFANLSLLYHYAKLGIDVTMISENDKMYVIYNSTKLYEKRDRGFISVFSITDMARDVKIKGLFYEYEGDLTNEVALGVSNEFCGKEALISVNDGALLIVEED